MIDANIQSQILDRIAQGIKICEEPYAELAQEFDVPESELLRFLNEAKDNGTVKRFGTVLNHHKLGFKANAMVVWSVDDEFVDSLGRLLAKEKAITLCYQRPRRLPHWPYNLFTMIHGLDSETVKKTLKGIVQKNGLEKIPHDILFSTKKFKQTGGRYNG